MRMILGSMSLYLRTSICDPPQEFDAKGESTLTARLHDTPSVLCLDHGYAHIKLKKQSWTHLALFW